MKNRGILGILGLVALGSISLGSASSWASDDEYTVELREIESGDPVDLDHALASEGGDVSWGDVIIIGEKIWKIIENGKPVSDVEQKAGVHVIPACVDGRWSKLQGWRLPAFKTYSLVYKNPYGMEVIRFTFTFSYNYGGNYRGWGRFLANVKVIPREASVAWGYKFNASVRVDEKVLNVGTSANPVAGLGLQVQWRLSTVMRDIQEAQDIFVDGTGKSTSTGVFTLPEKEKMSL